MRKYQKQKFNKRGVIEKRRRDKINNSLIELKSLVPKAVLKESSEKLEKAEILKLTVEYMKSLKNDCNMGENRSNECVDFREMGFRDCTIDMSNYLVNEEGLDYQHPFRLRLMSHLKCFALPQTSQSAADCNNFLASITQQQTEEYFYFHFLKAFFN